MRIALRVCLASLPVLILLASTACSRDPVVVSRKYLQNGNRYFDKGRYKEAYIMYRNALKKNPRYSDAYYRIALTELRTGSPNDAIRDLRRALDVDENNAEAKAQLADIYLVGFLSRGPGWENLGKEVQRLGADLRKKDAKSVPGLRLMGYWELIGNKNPAGAVALFQEANQLAPLKPDIVVPLAESLLADNRAAEAEKLARAYIQHDKTFGGTYNLLYMYYFRTNRLADAENILKLKVANNPKQADAYLQLAGFYFATHHLEQMQALLNKVSSNVKDFPGGHERVGRFQFARRDYDAALREFQLGMRDEPDNKARYQQLAAETLISQNKKQEAAALLDELLKQKPDDESAQALRASLQVDTGDPKQIQQAIDRLQAVVQQQPDNAVMRYNLGRALMAKAGVERARASFWIEQARVQFVESSNRQKNYLPPRLALAQLELVKRDFAMALQTADDALRIDPNNLNARLIRTSALAGMGRREQARSDLDATIKQFPSSQEAVVQLALLDLGEKRYKEAEDTFARLYKTNPNDPSGLLGLTESYAAAGEFDKAIQLLRGELARNPGRDQVHVALGNIAYAARKFDLAVQEYQIYAQAHPQSADVYVRIGAAYMRKQDFPNALAAFQRARALRPNDPDPVLQQALIYESTGQQAQARPLYDEVLKLQPDNAVALNNLAYILAETGGDLDQALALAQRAKDKLPQDPNVADTLGWIYIKKNLSDNAVQVLRALVSQKPDNPTYRYHLGMALLQKGDRPEARKLLQSALEKKPSKQEETKIRELMNKLG